MRTFFANLLIIIYVTMSVAAHGSPHLTSYHPDKTDNELVKTECTDKTHDFMATSNKACKNQPDKTPECEAMHCTFHYIFLDQSNANYIHGLRQGHARALESPLTALIPESAEKPPRLFS